MLLQRVFVINGGLKNGRQPQDVQCLADCTDRKVRRQVPLGPQHLLPEFWSSLNTARMTCSLKGWAADKAGRAVLSGRSLWASFPFSPSMLASIPHCPSGPRCAPISPASSGSFTKAAAPAGLCLAFHLEGLPSSTCLGPAMSQTPHPQCGPMLTLVRSAGDRREGVVEGSFPKTAGGQAPSGGICGGGHERLACSRMEFPHH